MSPQHLQALYSLGLSNIKLGLSNIKAILSRLDNPHHHPRIVHIAGTNGKGSTLAVLEKLLLTSGFTVGSTISPHLINYNERFRVGGISIDDKILNLAYIEVCRACGIDPDNFTATALTSEIKPTFFEFSIGIAFLIFAWKKVDFILLETGLGGRLDATNVVETPLACVLTRIALDHQEYLGESIEEITEEKLGIIKEQAHLFISYQEKAAQDVIEYYLQKKRFVFKSAPTNFGVFLHQNSQEFYLRETAKETTKRIFLEKIGLNGEHQLENIATALAVYWSIIPESSQLSEQQLQKSLQVINWKARLQYLNREKTILVDGAHNSSGMTSLLRYLQKEHCHQKILLALNWLKNKSYTSVFEEFKQLNLNFQPLEMKTKQGNCEQATYNMLKKIDCEVMLPINVQQFIQKKMVPFLLNYDLVVVTGSLYLVGEFLSEYELGNY